MLKLMSKKYSQLYAKKIVYKPMFYYVKLSPDVHTVPDVLLLNYYERKQCRFRLAGFTSTAMYFHSNNRTRNNVYETLCHNLLFIKKDGTLL